MCNDFIPSALTYGSRVWHLIKQQKETVMSRLQIALANLGLFVQVYAILYNCLWNNMENARKICIEFEDMTSSWRIDKMTKNLASKAQIIMLESVISIYGCTTWFFIQKC